MKSPGILLLLAATAASAHPMGNFSISHYSRITIERHTVEVRYLLDIAEIPTFQEMQQTGITGLNDARLPAYLAAKSLEFSKGLRLTIDGNPLTLRGVRQNAIFPPGAGNLPTTKMGFLYRAQIEQGWCTAARPCQLDYKDENLPGSSGWKEIVVRTGREVKLSSSTAPAQDRSGELSNYPTDLLNSPPQALHAEAVFSLPEAPVVAEEPVPSATPSRRSTTTALPSARPAPLNASRMPPSASPAARGVRPMPFSAGLVPLGPRPTPLSTSPAPVSASPTSFGATPTPLSTSPAALSTSSAPPSTSPAPRQLDLKPNRQATPRNAFTELMAKEHISLSFALLAALIAAGLGALHALEPGHGKTIVAAYLVGSRGATRHAVLLGAIVTISHTAGVYLLGGVTLYAQKYILPERLYPLFGVLSGILIAGMGFYIFLQRFVGAEFAHNHGPGGHSHGVRPKQLLVLGITGGIVPCPAALVVLLSAVALHRVAFGLFLIVAFSAGLAAVLIAMGMMAVRAGRMLSRLRTEGPLVQRWLPLGSAAMITMFGCAIAIQGLVAAGVLRINI